MLRMGAWERGRTARASSENEMGAGKTIAGPGKTDDEQNETHQTVPRPLAGLDADADDLC